jgi:hypothetical protein
VILPRVTTTTIAPPPPPTEDRAIAEHVVVTRDANTRVIVEDITVAAAVLANMSQDRRLTQDSQTPAPATAAQTVPRNDHTHPNRVAEVARLPVPRPTRLRLPAPRARNVPTVLLLALPRLGLPRF